MTLRCLELADTRRKLPCNSGIRLGMMEVEVGVRATVSSLVTFAKIRLPVVVHALTGALEILSKVSPQILWGKGRRREKNRIVGAKGEEMHARSEPKGWAADTSQHFSMTPLNDTPLDALHSQLYLLHILHLCLSTSWENQSQISPPRLSDLPRCWPDPYAFDDNLARYLLNVMMLYARILSTDTVTIPTPPSQQSRSNGGIPPKSQGPQWTMSRSCSFSPGIIQQHSYPSMAGPVVTSFSPRLLATSGSTPGAAINQMTKLVSRIIFYLSASNWPLVLLRIKSRISYLTTTIEEDPELVELRLLEWANIDRVRLGQVMQEVSIVFLNVKRPAQVIIAGVLRKAIWNWIDVYPEEYQTLVELGRPLEGGPDALFDLLHAMSEHSSASSAHRLKTMYPLMAMLLVISPDSSKRSISPDSSKRSINGNASRGASASSKKASFLQSLRKGLASNQKFEACVVCYVDFLRAATCLSPRFQGLSVRSSTPNIETDLEASFQTVHQISADIP